MPNTRYQQSYTNSCGAVALMCAAKELGIDTLPAVPPWDPNTPIPSPSCESQIFQYTGTGGPTVAVGNRGYSMPAKLAIVARTLGLKNPTIYMRPGFYATMLATFYDSAIRDANESGLPIVNQAPPQLQPWQRALKVMAVMKVVGLHWVMERPDGSYMDPGDGQDFASFDALKAPFLKSYADTGITLVVDSEWSNFGPLF
jgi:hypothetical protein